MKWLPWICISSLMMACAGEVHFVSPRVSQDQVDPPLVQLAQERFVYRTPNGNVKVFLSVHPRKSMRETIDGWKESFESFLTLLWAGNQQFEQIDITLGRDTYGGPTKRFVGSGSPETLPEAIRFFNHYWQDFHLEHTSGESENPYPFFSLSELALGAHQTETETDSTQEGYQNPTWSHYAYFRDYDINGDPNNPALPNPSHFEHRDSFIEAQRVGLASPFRYQLHLFSYWAGVSTCVEILTRFGVKWATLASDTPNVTHDLCRWNQNEHYSMVKDLVTSIHNQQSRMVLKKKPVRATLQVVAGGARVPSHEIIFDEPMNEVRISDYYANKYIPAGSEIKVTYEWNE